MISRLHDLIRRFALWLLGWVDACPSCGASWLEHKCPYALTTDTKRTCEICDRPLPVLARRTSQGRWRCAAHKATHVQD